MTIFRKFSISYKALLNVVVLGLLSALDVYSFLMMFLEHAQVIELALMAALFLGGALNIAPFFGVIVYLTLQGSLSKKIIESLEAKGAVDEAQLTKRMRSVSVAVIAIIAILSISLLAWVFFLRFDYIALRGGLRAPGNAVYRILLISPIATTLASMVWSIKAYDGRSWNKILMAIVSAGGDVKKRHDAASQRATEEWELDIVIENEAAVAKAAHKAEMEKMLATRRENAAWAKTEKIAATTRRRIESKKNKARMREIKTQRKIDAVNTKREHKELLAQKRLSAQRIKQDKAVHMKTQRANAKIIKRIRRNIRRAKVALAASNAFGRMRMRILNMYYEIYNKPDIKQLDMLRQAAVDIADNYHNALSHEENRRKEIKLKMAHLWKELGYSTEDMPPLTDFAAFTSRAMTHIEVAVMVDVNRNYGTLLTSLYMGIETHIKGYKTEMINALRHADDIKVWTIRETVKFDDLVHEHNNTVEDTHMAIWNRPEATQIWQEKLVGNVGLISSNNGERPAEGG